MIPVQGKGSLHYRQSVLGGIGADFSTTSRPRSAYAAARDFDKTPNSTARASPPARRMIGEPHLFF